MASITRKRINVRLTIEERSATYKAFHYRMRHYGKQKHWYGVYRYRAQFGFE